MRPCPANYSDFVSHRGGLNRNREPRYRIIWEPDRMEYVGGAWVDPDGTTRLEMRRIQKYGSNPNWIMEYWLPPEMYGSQETWDYENAYKMDNLVPEVSIQLIGKYPSRGEYEHIFTLSGTLHYYTLERLIRLHQSSLYNRNPEEEARLHAEIRAKQKEDWKKQIVEMYKSKAPAFYGPVSFANQKQHTALMDRLDQVVKTIERGYSGEEMKEALGLKGTQVR